MAPNFSKNAILIGMVDYFCLVCEAYLKSEGDTEVHIAKPVHQQHLQIIQYIDEFKEDGIKKIKNKYFCEICNKVLTVLARVRLHVSEQTHNDNKNRYLLKRAGNSIIAFDNVVISDQAWNGLHENSCAVCNVEYEEEEIHKNQSTHILNVIQTQTEFDKDRNIYRKIDEFSFHCLTCNMVHALNSLTSHFAENEHRKKYKACIAKEEIIINVQPEKVSDDKIIDNELLKPKATCNVKEVNNENKEKNHDEQTKKPKVTFKENECTQKTKENNHNKEIIRLKVVCNVNEVNNENKEKNHDDQTKKPKVTFKENEFTQKTKENNHNMEIIKAKVVCNVNEGTHETNEKNHDDKKQKNISTANEVLNAKETNRIKQKISKTKQQKSGKDIDLYESQKLIQYFYDDKAEDRICKVLGCKNYITQDENDKTWCILCDWLMNPSNIGAHINGKHHQTILKMHKERADKMKDKCNKNKARADAQKDILKILDSLNKFQKNDVIVNFDSKLATCKKCCKGLAFDYDSIESHILEHNTANKECETKIVDAVTNAVSDKYKDLVTSPVLINQANNSDQSKLEPLNIEKDHKVEHEKIPKGYRKIVRTTGPKMNEVKLLKVPTSKFVVSMVAVENMMFKDVIINNKYCINILSLCFMYQMPMSDMFTCLACQENFYCDDYDVHCSLNSHEIAVNESPVIVNDDTEFIREIGPKFHCGFCNRAELSWADMESHLKSNAHKESKVAATWRLENYQPSIANDQFDRVLRNQIAAEAFLSHFF